MIEVKIKALSVNEAYRGRRFKTNKYKAFEQELWYLLPNKNIPKGKLEIYYKFGLSSKGSDYDNCIKAFQDILQKKYVFNDNLIYKATIEKEDVKKGEEYIKFEIKKLST